MTTYTRLRSLGVSIECADELAPILDAMSERKREARILDAMGYNQAEIAKRLGCGQQHVSRLLVVCVK